MEDDKKISDMTVDDLAHQLKMCLSRQKYLIVLDDIWDVSAWNEVKSSFPDDSNGSIVMFTTRSREVAENCKIRCSPHQLRFLSEVESWDLLQRKVFRNGLSPPYLDEIGRVIAKNCKGLPLAVVVIASLLATTEKSPRWWSEVAENVVSYLSEERCMKILELSYKHLPENLKPCLLYLAAFPEGMQIGVKKVILLWIAEGFIQESRTNSLEDVAIEYFHDLVDRSLIIVSARSSNGGIKAFRVHDLIYELCQTKCREGNISHLDYGIASSSSSDPPSIIEHYRISMRKIKDINNIASGPSQSNARSVFYFRESDGGVGYFTVEKFRLAQVLNLDIELSEYDLKMLGYLVHLRHIDVYLRLESKYIPSLICNLWNIGSLLLTSAPGGRIHLPETFWRMKSLRHVNVENCILKFSDGQEAYLKLDKVVSFSKPILRTGKDVQRLLQRLPAVRKLGFSLESFGNNVETLDFYRGIESLKLHQFYTRRQFMIKNFPSTLKKLTLEHFQLPWTAISAIAELQCLEVLKLIGVSFPEPRLEMENETFQNLKFLKIRDGGLLRWNATTESFPCIEQLVIECRELKQLPSCFGEIPTLKRIAVSRHSSEVVKSSVLRIQEEQMELGIEVEVSILE